MLVSIIAIGNSKGVRIPKSVIDQLHISDKVEMEIENHQIILKPIKSRPREGWDISFKKMHVSHDDMLIIPESPQEEAFQWEW